MGGVNSWIIVIDTLHCLWIWSEKYVTKWRNREARKLISEAVVQVGRSPVGRQRMQSRISSDLLNTQKEPFRAPAGWLEVSGGGGGGGSDLWRRLIIMIFGFITRHATTGTRLEKKPGGVIKRWNHSEGHIWFVSGRTVWMASSQLVYFSFFLCLCPSMKTIVNPDLSAKPGNFNSAQSVTESSACSSHRFEIAVVTKITLKKKRCGSGSWRGGGWGGGRVYSRLLL